MVVKRITLSQCGVIYNKIAVVAAMLLVKRGKRVNLLEEWKKYQKFLEKKYQKFYMHVILRPAEYTQIYNLAHYEKRLDIPGVDISCNLQFHN